jgi:hypothetical protein
MDKESGPVIETPLSGGVGRRDHHTPVSSTACDRMIRPRLIALAALSAVALAPGCTGGNKVGDIDSKPPLQHQLPMRSSTAGEGIGGGPNSITISPTTKGYLRAADIKAGVSPEQGRLLACFQDRLKDRPFLSGDLRLQFQVQKTGQVGTASIIESTVGDWSVEYCVVEVARHVTFDRPTGGDGTAEFSMLLHFASDQAAAVEVSTEAKIAPVVTRHASELRVCTGAPGGAAPADVTVTVYIGNRGEVKAAGFSAPKPIADTWANCAAKAIAKWTFTDPMAKIVKAAFHVPPATR